MTTGGPASSSSSSADPATSTRSSSASATSGPIAAGDLQQRVGPKGSWWSWDDGKLALEYLFHHGRLAAIRRRSDFARLYDLPERVLPAAALDAPTPTEAEARKELLALAARSLGVATFEDLTDYHRQKQRARASRSSPSSSRTACCCRRASRAGPSRPTSTATRRCPAR